MMDLSSLLEQAGFRVRGNRADCPYCEGVSRLTVSIGEDTFYCHRCGMKGGAHSLARKLGSEIPQETATHRDAREVAKEFSTWANACERELIIQHRRQFRRVAIARVALNYFPEMEVAWAALADAYHAEAKLNAALDTFSLERAGNWLEEPATPESLFRSWKGEKRCAA